MKLIKKIALAKDEIKDTPLKKEGKNSFSNYIYFTPQQIELLVNQVCKSQKILTKFDLIRDSLGVFGRLTIFDCESDETIEYVMASAIPEIKATNIAQQLGGCVTYTERYLKMSAFGITDSNLDFDNHNQDKKLESDQKKLEADRKQKENDILDNAEKINACTNLKALQDLYLSFSKEMKTSLLKDKDKKKLELEKLELHHSEEIKKQQA